MWILPYLNNELLSHIICGIAWFVIVTRPWQSHLTEYAFNAYPNVDSAYSILICGPSINWRKNICLFKKISKNACHLFVEHVIGWAGQSGLLGWILSQVHTHHSVMVCPHSNISYFLSFPSTFKWSLILMNYRSYLIGTTGQFKGKHTFFWGGGTQSYWMSWLVYLSAFGVATDDKHGILHFQIEFRFS